MGVFSASGARQAFMITVRARDVGARAEQIVSSQGRGRAAPRRSRPRRERLMTPRKVGLLVGREWSWPPRFIEEVASRRAGVVAEHVRLGGTRMDEPVEYAVLIDRI